MNASKSASARKSKTDLKRVDAHQISASEYEELPELTDEMLARGTFKKAGRPIATNPRLQVTIRLPADVLAAWKATGPGWQTRMAERLSKPTK
ncbi:BrnA antitoxin family protein [Luteimonas sp. FXH3W]|uniref:BrnA antitoxin family protein n=1 Tax=Aquilutibacter rugosus TaxID=3115820 RepID=A0ABU7UX02_9GAMM